MTVNYQRLIDFRRLAAFVFGCPVKASVWMSSPLVVLSGMTPEEAVQTKGGIHQVRHILLRHRKIRSMSEEK